MASSWLAMSSCTGQGCNGGTSWTTPPHALPQPDFTWLPSQPTAEYPITFTDASTFAPGSTNKSWNWSFPGGTPSTRTTRGPHDITYGTPGLYNPTLTASDNAGSCSISKPINIDIALPVWREIAPR